MNTKLCSDVQQFTCSQAAPVPDPESAVSKQASVAESAPSSTVPETEVSAELFPVLDEPAVLSEASSVTAAEISSAQTPTGIGIIDLNLCLPLYLDRFNHTEVATDDFLYLLLRSCGGLSVSRDKELHSL